MARPKVTISRRGLNEALSQRGVREVLQSLVNDVVDRAERGAPVESGDYRDSIHGEIDDGWVRPRGRIIADVPYAMNVESKTGNLARALGTGKGLVKYVSRAGKTSYITQAQYDNYTRGR